MLQISQNLANFAAISKFRLDNLVDLKNILKNAVKRVFTRKDRCRYSRKRLTFCRNFDRILTRASPAARAPGRRDLRLGCTGTGGACTGVPVYRYPTLLKVRSRLYRS